MDDPSDNEISINARVTNLRICENDKCSLSLPYRHLIIEKTEIPLRRGSATAISYVWGEFDREKEPIGHAPGNGQEVIHMVFGKEWIIRDVVDRLAEVANTKPIRIDQLCIPQREDKIRETLAKIPLIYRTLEVVVLMPGHPCACLPKLRNEIKQIALAHNKEDNLPFVMGLNKNSCVMGISKNTFTTASNEDIFDLGYDRDFFRMGFNKDTEEAIGRTQLENVCLNACPLSSWVRRLWPRQELGYSRSVRCVWSGKGTASCASESDIHFKGDVDSGDLQPYAARLFQRSLRKCNSSNEHKNKVLAMQVVSRWSREHVKEFFLGHAQLLTGRMVLW